MLQKPHVLCTTLQFCYVFYTTFSLFLLSLILERCTKYTYVDLGDVNLLD